MAARPSISSESSHWARPDLKEQDHKTLDPDHPSRDADQDWGQSDLACPAPHIPNGRGRCARRAF